MDASLHGAPTAGDLRGPAMDRKRDTDSKQKWAGGEAISQRGFGKIVPRGKGNPQSYNDLRRRTNERSVKARNSEQKRDRLDTSMSDVYDECHRSTKSPSGELYGALDPYADMMGVHVHAQAALGSAIDKALHDFEDKETSKLVKKEYEVLDSSSADEETELLHDYDDDFELL